MVDIQKELALRLAWYIDRYGEMPQKEIIKLWAGTTLGQKDEQTERVVALANEIIAYFRSMD